MVPKIGLLLPRSALYPTINFDLVEGLRGGLSTGFQEAPEIETENIGVGAQEQQIYAACERMLLSGVGIIAGYVNSSTTLKLQPLFEAANAVFICMDSGYQFLPAGTGKLPNVIFVSLQGALCCRATATLALEQGFKSFATTTSFLDAGFRCNYAFHRTVEGGGGGIAFNHVAALKRIDFSLEPLFHFLHNNTSTEQGILAAYCGDMLVDFCAHAKQHKALAGNLFVSPFMLEETWLRESMYPGTNLQGVVTWATALETPENRHFLETMAAKRRSQNVFSVLGWEAGQIMARLLQQKEQQGAMAVNELADWHFKSPRGAVYIESDTLQTIAPLYNAQGICEEDGEMCQLQLSGSRSDGAAQWKLLQADIEALTGPSTNWLNSYPCIET